MPTFSARGLSSAPVTNILDEGLYDVRIASAEAIVSSQKGTPGIKFDFVVQAGPIQNSGSVPANRHIFHTLYVPDSGQGHDIALTKLAKLCRAVDIDQADELDLAELVNKRLVVKLKHRQFQGEAQEDVTDYKKAAN